MQIINKIEKKNIMFYLLLLYYITTYLLYRFGPVIYPDNNINKSSFFLILYFLSFILGYKISSKIDIKPKNLRKIDEKYLLIILKIGLLTSAFFSIAYFINFSGSINPIIITENLFTGFTNPEIGYINNINIEKTSSIITQLTTLMSPLTFAVIPMGVLLFNKLTLKSKISYVLVVLLDCLQYIIKGTNFGIFKILISIIIVFIVLYSNENSKKINKKNILLLSLLGCFFMFYFLLSISSRLNYSQIPETYLGLKVNQTHSIFKVIPLVISIPLFIATTYFSQGYYGFDLAFNYPFSSTFGLGSGRFLISYGEKIFGIDLWSRTYQYKMDDIWSSRVSWHTAFTWFSNDVGFYGVVIIMVIIGFLFGIIITDAYDNHSVIAVILLPLYVILLIFLPSNNIVFDNPTLFIPFIVMNLVWFCNLYIQTRVKGSKYV